MKQFPFGARAVTDARVLRFPASLFPNLVQKMPELTQRLVGLIPTESVKPPGWSNSATG